jgi:hypothetical protein
MRIYCAVVSLSVCIVSFGLAGCASHRPLGTHRTAVEREALVTVTAVDVPKRLVTVRDASGEANTFYVDESNKNFPQAGVGDQVRVRYVESMALRLTKKKPGEVKMEETTSRPKEGRASGRASTEVTAVVRIEAVRPDGSLVVFTGPRGRRAVQVHDPGMRHYVRDLQPGDNVEVVYEEALALSLEKVSP